MIDLKAAITRVEALPETTERAAVLTNLRAQLAGECTAYMRDEDVEADIADLERRAELAKAAEA